MFSDYHVHSCFSFDSDEQPENIIKQALKLGMPQICITDHQDFHWPVSGEHPIIDFDSYFVTLKHLQKKYQQSIQLLIGIELGLMQGTEHLNRELLENHDFDFVIGSCHVVEHMDPYYPDFWKNRTDREAFELYFKTLSDVLKSFHQINALGHLDYIVRYSPNKDCNYSTMDYQDIIDEILSFIIHHEILLEINTANLAKGFSFPNPHTDIIKRYQELGGRYVTIGSDAHKASDIGFGFDMVQSLLSHYALKIYHR